MLSAGPAGGTRSGGGDHPDEHGWWDGQSQWAKSGTVCAIGLVALLIVCGGIVAWGAATHRGPTAAADRSATSAAPAGSPAPAVTAPAGRPAEPTDRPADSPAPADVTWLQVGLGGLPFSPTTGPRQIHGGVPAGFAHTPTGAVLASIQILGRLSWSAQTPAAMRAVAASLTLPSAHALASLTYGPPTDPAVIPAVAGFQVVTYSPAQAVINVALRFNGALRVMPATMRWTASDWRLAGAPGPLDQTNWAQIGDLTGFVLFSGQPTQMGP